MAEAECNVIEQERAFKAIIIEKEGCLKELDEVKQELTKLRGVSSENENAKTNEKLTKFKEIYNKLREEHIELLRSVI